MKLKLLICVNAFVFCFFAVRASKALEVTLGPGGDHADLASALAAVQDAGEDGSITILDNATYEGNHRIDRAVNITIHGNLEDPPSLFGDPDCPNSNTSDLCPGPENDKNFALFHFKNSPNGGAEGGSLTINGCMVGTGNCGTGHLWTAPSDR